jgi:hypothetical protein
VKRAVTAGAKTNFLASDGVPALDRAIFLDHPELVAALLQGGADPNAGWMSHGDRFPLKDNLSTHAIRSFCGPAPWLQTPLARALVDFNDCSTIRWLAACARTRTIFEADPGPNRSGDVVNRRTALRWLGTAAAIGAARYELSGFEPALVAQAGIDCWARVAELPAPAADEVVIAAVGDMMISDPVSNR